MKILLALAGWFGISAATALGWSRFQRRAGRTPVSTFYPRYHRVAWSRPPVGPQGAPRCHLGALCRCASMYRFEVGRQRAAGGQRHETGAAWGGHRRSASRHVAQRAPFAKAISSRSGRFRACGVQPGTRSNPAITALQPS
jgi:hypothetical protein